MPAARVFLGFSRFFLDMRLRVLHGNLRILHGKFRLCYGFGFFWILVVMAFFGFFMGFSGFGTGFLDIHWLPIWHHLRHLISLAGARILGSEAHMCIDLRPKWHGSPRCLHSVRYKASSQICSTNASGTPLSSIQEGVS